MLTETTNIVIIATQYASSQAQVVNQTISSMEPEDMLRGFMISEIYRIRSIRKKLREEYPELLNHGAE